MPHFVLLYHECPSTYSRASHWDLMLESGDMLRTWALNELPRDWGAAQSRTCDTYPCCPSLATDNEVAAEQLADHRREYLEFEGDLTNDRGRVIRIAAGAYETVAESPTGIQIAINEDEGLWRLRLSRSDKSSARWQLRLDAFS